MWTLFWDMNSGGGRKEKWPQIYIEAPEDEAKVIFYNRFGHNPERVTCTCCGQDYSISSDRSLEQLSAFHRGCRSAWFIHGREVPEEKAWVRGKGVVKGATQRYVDEADTRSAYKAFIPFKKWIKGPKPTTGMFLAGTVPVPTTTPHSEPWLIIRAAEIKPEERKGQVPAQGYVWVD